MDMVKLVRRSVKTVLFMALFCLFARLIDASQFISLDTANKFSTWFHGSANQENYDDLWFFTDVMLSLLSSVVAYNVLIRLFRKFIKRIPERMSQH
ncbi:hypothetical protein [Pantoea cypripedii]|uniref:Uncharacterized protein n=1 Tax=Pantoea cypripedii TaxID=55209 RepID=A0A6B9G7N9_PANCY|nr:hypothetical protein [Pantoea cypripedii]QGY32622.1 hypothetical protein CUN67_27120 [Pantoea cypripedii]